MVRQSETATTPLADPQDPVICRCLAVRQSEIVNAITLCGAQTWKEVKSLTGAGGGCNCCHGRIKGLISACSSCPIRIAQEASAEKLAAAANPA